MRLSTEEAAGAGQGAEILAAGRGAEVLAEVTPLAGRVLSTVGRRGARWRPPGSTAARPTGA
ncbi:hypothetical protein [Streptomyces sp. NPDC004629]|uniref:hypothetical protein n=1 Tax=Streptomyces sp. NPDC004629 TaxID=3364705 RepID=UPI0036C9B5BC